MIVCIMCLWSTCRTQGKKKLVDLIVFVCAGDSTLFVSPGGFFFVAVL